MLLAGDGLSDEIGNPDVAVILGNKVNPDGSLSPRLRARVERGRDLFLNGTVQKLIVSGATGKEGVNEAVAMKRYLVARGVRPGDVLLDSKGVNTRATAVNALGIMKREGLSEAVVVSQYFHIPRCKLAFRQAGHRRVSSVHARYFEWRDVFSVSRAMIAYPVYWLGLR